MDEEKKWMLMTYYCPTHGDSGLAKPIQPVSYTHLTLPTTTPV